MQREWKAVSGTLEGDLPGKRHHSSWGSCSSGSSRQACPDRLIPSCLTVTRWQASVPWVGELAARLGALRSLPPLGSHGMDRPGAGSLCGFWVTASVTWACPTPSDPMDCSLPGSSVHGIFQSRVLEWGAIAFFDSICIYIHKYVLLVTSYT